MSVIIPNRTKVFLDDIRHFIMDREAADNPLLLDLAFSDEEIHRATRFACLSFNEIKPYTITVTPDSIPFEMVFIHGVLYHLYLSTVSKLSRNEVDHQAGDINVDVEKRLIANLKEMMQFHKKEFEVAAYGRKLDANINAAFAYFR